MESYQHLANIYDQQKFDADKRTAEIRAAQKAAQEAAAMEIATGGGEALEAVEAVEAVEAQPTPPTQPNPAVSEAVIADVAGAAGDTVTSDSSERDGRAFDAPASLDTEATPTAGGSPDASESELPDKVINHSVPSVRDYSDMAVHSQLWRWRRVKNIVVVSIGGGLRDTQVQYDLWSTCGLPVVQHAV